MSEGCRIKTMINKIPAVHRISIAVLLALTVLVSASFLLPAVAVGSFVIIVMALAYALIYLLVTLWRLE